MKNYTIWVTKTVYVTVSGAEPQFTDSTLIIRDGERVVFASRTWLCRHENSES